MWAAVSAAVNKDAYFAPPKLPAPVWTEVASGRIARLGDTAASGRVVAVGVIHASRPAVWLALTDDHLSDNVDSLTEVALRGAWSSPKTLYQRLDLPWPVTDRHWVIDLRNNATLAAAGVWERAWTLDRAALLTAREHTDIAGFDAAAAIATNDGSWLLVSIDTHDTLAVYQARVQLGGALPDGAVDAFTRGQVDGLYSGIRKGAESLSKRYGAGCRPQPAPDGSPIPCF